MASFTDNLQRSWDLTIDVNSAKRCKKLIDFDLWSLLDAEEFAVFASDISQVVDVIYCVAKPQVDAASLSDEDFGAAMVGTALDDGAEALVESIVAFLSARRNGEVQAIPFTAGMKAAKLKVARVEASTGDIRAKIEEVLAKEADEFDRKLTAALSGTTSTNAEAS